MRILLVHNETPPGGEENEIFAAEGRLLESFGHDVERYTVPADAANEYGRLALARRMIWNKAVEGELRDRIAKHQPEIVHFHNTFPLISPGAYYGARESGAAVVQTLTDYRLLCANGRLYRAGAVCEACIGKNVATPAVRHKCYGEGRIASAGAIAMVAIHRRMGTWTSAVDMYIVPSAFARARFLHFGLPGTKVMVKPHFVEKDPGRGTHHGRYAIWVGPLTDEQGFRTVHEAWERVGKWLPLKVVGEGPLETLSRERVRGIEWLGRVAPDEVTELMKDALFLVSASNALEVFSMPIIQGYATGLPAITTGHGALAELVPDGVSGLVFEPGNSAQLEGKIVWALKNPEEWSKIINNSRRFYEVKYTAARSHELLVEAYRRALGTRTGRSVSEPVTALRQAG